MEIISRDSTGVRVLDLAGDIKTPQELDAFSKAVDAEIAQKNTNLLLNFKKVNFINSSGLGRLILAVKKIGEAKGTLGVFHLADDLEELFSFTRLKEKIAVYKDEEEAVSSLLKSSDA